MTDQPLVERLHATLVGEIRARRPQYLKGPFTVAEIYQELVPYRTHRDLIGAAMNGDYEHALLRLLSGEGDFIQIESEGARRRMAEELESPDPNTGVIREFAALDVRLNPARIPPEPPHPPAGVPETRAEPASAFRRPDLTREGELDPSPGGGVEVAAVAGATPTPAPAPAPAPAPEPRADSPLGVATAEPAPRAEPAGASPAGEHAPCRWCREELPKKDTLRFCPFCGMDVSVVPCPACGEELEPQWRFCIACGAQVVTED